MTVLAGPSRLRADRHAHRQVLETTGGYSINPLGLADALGIRAMVALDSGDFDGARASANRALEIAEAARSVRLVPALL